MNKKMPDRLFSIDRTYFPNILSVILRQALSCKHAALPQHDGQPTCKITKKNCGDRIWTYDLRVMSPTSFQTAPPRAILCILWTKKADDRTRTDNLLITNQLLCQLSHIGLFLNGWRWIRTTEAICSRFTVCPLWPLGNPSKCFMGPIGLEPMTLCL